MKKLLFVLLLISFANLFTAAQEIDERTLHHKITKKEQRALDKGNKIIAALEEYYKDNGFYPQELDELVPKYLLEIEEPGFVITVRPEFQYKAEPLKYRNGYFKISYPDYEKGKVKEEDRLGYATYYSCYYDSRDDKVKPVEKGGFFKEVEWIDKISEKDIRQIADAVKRYFGDYKEFPKKLEDVVPEYLPVLPIALNPRYKIGENGIPYSYVFYEYQNPLKDDESEFAQCYSIRFDYRLGDYEFKYATYDKKWKFILH